MSVNNKQWYGLPLNLIWGYVAIAVFMTGDGFELAFLSHYIKALGFTPAQASFAFTLYGLAAALSAWVSGVVAEIITPRKAMMIGFVLWCVFHVLFLVFGLGRANYALILLFYGIRGPAYPLFLYSFIVAIIHNVRSDSSSSALGWFWAVYSVGIGVFGSYIPSFTIPHIGEMGTLWLALVFCATGGIIALVSMRHTETPRHMQNLTTREKLAELGRAATLLYTNRSILFSSIVRIINTLSLFGFAVIMPMMFVDELGFTTSGGSGVGGLLLHHYLFERFLGIVAEKMGWMKVIRWFGCIGMAFSSRRFTTSLSTLATALRWRWCRLLPGIFVAAFVPMAAVFPALEPNHKGAAISVYNLSAGLSNFLAPAIAVVLLPYFSTIGVVIAYTALYILAFFLCPLIRVEQPGFTSAQSAKPFTANAAES